jgi:hypothetical protein
MSFKEATWKKDQAATNISEEQGQGLHHEQDVIIPIAILPGIITFLHY